MNAILLKSDGMGIAPWQFTIGDLLLATGLFAAGLATLIISTKVSLFGRSPVPLFFASFAASSLFGAAAGAPFQKKSNGACLGVLFLPILLSIAISVCIRVAE